MTTCPAPLSELFLQKFKFECEDCVKLAQAGSDRVYYRLTGKQRSAIGTINHDHKENETFIYLARHFKSRGVNVPEIYGVSPDGLCYLQEDLGGQSLYDLVRKEGFTPEIESWYKKVLVSLLSLQMDGAEGFDFSHCYPVQAFDKTSMFWDLNSFKYYFARPARVLFHEPSLQRDFHRLTDWLLQEPLQYFMMRDCQARNVMLKDDQAWFIDFQGGRKGAVQYDVASLLWQAGARIPMNKRAELLDFYTGLVAERIPSLDREAFKERYYGYLLIRMLQVLSAYGFRGLFEGRGHFVESIPPALENVSWFLQNISLPVELPELYQTLESLCRSEQFKPKEWNGADSPLTVYITSFSYKKGLPDDPSGNGGGYIFDCRGLHNPGRYEAYKSLSGKDEAVRQFLKSKSRVEEFLQYVLKVVEISVENYIERGFEYLQINFGCTGGQHRSVFCAEQTAAHLSKKYGVKIILEHRERESWKKDQSA